MGRDREIPKPRPKPVPPPAPPKEPWTHYLPSHKREQRRLPYKPEEQIRERKRVLKRNSQLGLNLEDKMPNVTLKKKGLGLAKTMSQAAADEIGPKPVPLPPHKPKGPHPNVGWSPGASMKPRPTDAPARSKKAKMKRYGSSMDGIDGRNMPPVSTMEYDPDRDGRADMPIDNWDGEDPGFENMGKQENNKKWSYGQYRAKEGRPIPEDQHHVFNDLFDTAHRAMPDTVNGVPEEISQWERNVRRQAREAGLDEEEINQLLDDLYDFD